MINRTLGKSAHIRGAVAIRRSMPFLYASLDTTTTVTWYSQQLPSYRVITSLTHSHRQKAATWLA